MKWVALLGSGQIVGAAYFLDQRKGSPNEHIENFHFVDDLEARGVEYRPHKVGATGYLHPNLALPHDTYPQPFENEGAYEPVAPARPGYVECRDSPNWKDKDDNTCARYNGLNLCTKEKKKGPKWDDAWGTIEEAASPSAFEACCACGGGHSVTVMGPRPLNSEDRELQPYADRFPEIVYTHGRRPEGRKIEENLRPVAEQDKVPEHLTRYIHQLRNRIGEVTPSGLSTQFFDKAPEDWSDEQKWGTPLASQLTGFLYYSNDVGRMLRWPLAQKGVSAPKPFYVRWSGTLSILQAGDYNFSLALSTRSRSQVMVGGQKIVTRGQCGSATLKDDCTMDGCTWSSSDACLPSSSSDAPAPVSLPDKGVCLSVILEVADRAALIRFEYSGPDTNGLWTTVPTTVLSCNPVCPACERPREDACTKEAKDEAAIA